QRASPAGEGRSPGTAGLLPAERGTKADTSCGAPPGEQRRPPSAAPVPGRGPASPAHPPPGHAPAAEQRPLPPAAVQPGGAADPHEGLISSVEGRWRPTSRAKERKEF